MNRSWSPPTPLAMVCRDCRRELPRGTVRHSCTAHGNMKCRQNVLVVKVDGKNEIRTTYRAAETHIARVYGKWRLAGH